MQGLKYNVSNGHPCAFPESATPNKSCPDPYMKYSFVGVKQFNLSDYDDNPPIVYCSVSMVQFGGIDQTQLTFTVSLSI